MTSLFIKQLHAKHIAEQEKIKKRLETSNRIFETATKGNSYNWGVIQELKKDVAPTIEAVFVDMCKVRLKKNYIMCYKKLC